MEKPVIVGWPKALTWNDFDKIDKSAGRRASCKYSLKPEYEKAKRRLGNAWGPAKTKVVIKLSRANTWVVKGHETPEMLRHEQGHYDIGGLAARELWWTLKFLSADSPEDLESAVGAARRKVDSKTQKHNFRYDRETRHGEDSAQQSRWDRLIKGCIDESKNLPELK